MTQKLQRISAIGQSTTADGWIMPQSGSSIAAEIGKAMARPERMKPSQSGPICDFPASYRSACFGAATTGK